VATAGLRLAREQSLTVRLLNLLTIANTPSTTTVLDSPFLLMLVTSSSYTTCLLPYRPAITFRSPHCCSSSDPSLWVRQPSPPYDCSPITVLKLQQIHFAAFWALQLQPRCPAVLADKLLDFIEIKLRRPHRVHNCYSESAAANEASSQPHPPTKLTYPILESTRSKLDF
jgi:hypothetical protein